MGPHHHAHFQLEKGDGTTGKREKYHKEIKKREECTRGTKDHNREEGRV